MNETEKLINDQFMSLPLHTQQAISAVPWKMLVKEIGKSKGLNTEQIMALEQETMFIIYALEDPNDYISNIIREMQIEEEMANKIAEAVVNTIFEPILAKAEELEKAQETQKETLKTSAPVENSPQLTVEKPKDGEAKVTTALPPENLPTGNLESGSMNQESRMDTEKQKFEETTKIQGGEPRELAAGIVTETPAMPEIPEARSVNQESSSKALEDYHEQLPPAPKNSYPGGKDPYREPIE